MHVRWRAHTHDALEHRAINRNQFCLSSGWSSQKESDAVRGGVTDKSHDALGGRRSQTRRAERICANLGASRLARSAATRCDGPLDLVTNPPRQNGPDLSPDALTRQPALHRHVGSAAWSIRACTAISMPRAALAQSSDPSHGGEFSCVATSHAGM